MLTPSIRTSSRTSVNFFRVLFNEKIARRDPLWPLTLAPVTDVCLLNASC